MKHRLFACALLVAIAIAGPSAIAVAGSEAAGSLSQVEPSATAIKVLSSRAWVDSGYLHIVGDVKNTSSSWRRFVEIDARLYNSSGQVLGSDFTFALLDLVAPGKRAPFHLMRQEPNGYHHYRLSTSSSTTSQRPIRKLTVHDGVPYEDFGYRHYPGEVSNGNGFKVKFVQVVITLFDANGKVVNVDFTFTNPSTVPAHATRGFEAIFTDHYSDAVTVRYQVQAQR
jgi:hypothetical protein